MAIPVRRRDPRMRAQSPGAPIRELEELQEQTAQLMESVLSGIPVPAPTAWVPPVDIEETEDSWIVEAELPGVDRGDVTVTVRDNELHISGEIKEKERKGVLRRRTRRVGEFEFRVTLPGDVDPDGVEASLDDGILTVRVPRADRAQARQIEVKRSG